MYILTIHALISIIAISFLFIGLKQISLSSLSIFNYRLQDLVYSSQGKVASSILGFILGLIMSENGAFTPLNNIVSKRKSYSSLTELLSFNILGQYAFAMILFLPIPYFLSFLIITAFLLRFLDGKYYHQTISLLVGLIIIKIGAIAFSFGLSSFKELAPNIFHSSVAYVGFILLGLAFSLTFRSLMPSLLITGILMNYGLQLYGALLIIAGIHTGIGLYYWIVSLSLRAEMLKAVKSVSLIHCFVAVCLLTSYLPISSLDINYSHIYNWLIITGIVTLALLLGVLFFTGRTLSRTTEVQSLSGKKYFERYAFANHFSGSRLLVREISYFIVALLDHINIMRSELNHDEDNILRNTITHDMHKRDFKELIHYSTLLQNIPSSPKIIKQSQLVTEIIRNLGKMENNFYEESLMIKDLDPNKKVKYSYSINSIINLEESFLKNYIGVFKNPEKDRVIEISEVASDLGKAMSYQSISTDDIHELILIEYFNSWEMNLDIIKKINLLLESWVNFYPRYLEDPLRFQYQ